MKDDTKNFDDSHHKPRDHKKKKKPKSNFAEDRVANRQARIGFKNYLREIEEEELDDLIEEGGYDG
jgi:hypothetical protein